MTMRTELPAARAHLEGCGAKTLLCAVSGGLDSVCLLHFVLHWGRERGCRVEAAHFHHGLRGESADRDQAFVEALCKAWEVPLTLGRGDTRAYGKARGLSVEEAARALRYDFLEATAKAVGAERILTAHHREDNAETILLNLIRGTGLRGLCGIPPERGPYLRIFLETPREDLEAYSRTHKLSHVEDETNFDPDAAARNLLRLSVLPRFRELNPKATEHMGSVARELREIDDYLEEETHRRMQEAQQEGEQVKLPLRALQEAPPPLRGRMLLRLFELSGCGR